MVDIRPRMQFHPRPVIWLTSRSQPQIWRISCNLLTAGSRTIVDVSRKTSFQAWCQKDTNILRRGRDYGLTELDCASYSEIAVFKMRFSRWGSRKREASAYVPHRTVPNNALIAIGCTKCWGLIQNLTYMLVEWRSIGNGRGLYLSSFD